MSTQVGERVEVGSCDLGSVFIFHFASKGDYTDAPAGETWQVRAGNHTVATCDSEERANAVAIALCGHDRLNNAFVADVAPVPETMAAYVKETRERVGKK